MKNTRLPSELQAAWEDIEGFARDYGLDFYPIIYEVRWAASRRATRTGAMAWSTIS
jgi:spore cortex formation protein SpoVR/YcgB (stage V sporulation)